MTKIFKKPVIRRFKDKWYVEYYFADPNYLVDGAREFKRFKVYEDINRYSGKDKEEYAKELRDAVEKALNKGYNPFEQDEIVQEEIRQEEEAELKKEDLKGISILTLLDRYMAAMKKNGLTAKSVGGYSTPINHFKTWIASKGWSFRGVKEFTENDLRDFLLEMQAERDWTGRTYNNVRMFVKMWFEWFEMEGYVDKNPITRRLGVQKTVSTKNEDYHGRAREQMKEVLKTDPLMELVCNVVYYSALRSYMELSQITVGDVDLQNRVIKIKESVGKTGYRFVPICDELNDIFVKMNLQDHPLDHYLFGKNGQISNERLYKNFLSNRYALLRKQAGLSQEYTLYSWKHTRVVDLKNAGYTDAEIQDLTGHKDSKSFDVYARNFGLRLNTKLKGKTLEF